MKHFISLIFLIVISFSCKESADQGALIHSDANEVIALEKLEVSSYTYVRVKQGTDEFWVAAPLSNIVIGDAYQLNDPMEMQNFESKELNRVFPLIYFVSELRTANDKSASFAEPEISGSPASINGIFGAALRGE